MLRSIRKMKGMSVAARDGDIGTVRDVLFDDRQWTVRFLAVDTGGWIPGRQVLISPVAIREVDWRHESIRVGLARDAVKGSPHPAGDERVTRRHERHHFAHYGWPFYLGGPNAWGTGLTPQELAVAADYPGVLPQVAAAGDGGEAADPDRHPGSATAGGAAGGARDGGTSGDEARRADEESSADDEHLHSARALMKSCLQGLDGSPLNINDLLADDSQWRIRYLSVGTGEWFTGDHVLLAPEWIDRADFEERILFAELTREEILQGPLWDPRAPVDREYQRHLHGEAWPRPGPADTGRDLAP